MGDASTDRLPQIVNREEHDAIITREAQIANTPILIYVSSSVPRSIAFTPKLIELSKKPEYEDVKFYEMEMTAQTTPMIKFGPQNCPLVFLFRNLWCKTLLGIRSVEEVEGGIREMLGRE